MCIYIYECMFSLLQTYNNKCKIIYYILFKNEFYTVCASQNIYVLIKKTAHEMES